MLFGIITMYKYAQIEEKWTLRVIARIKQMEHVEDVVVGQPLLIWSIYTYNSALAITPALWICLVLEEWGYEVKRASLFLVNGYCSIFPRHRFSMRSLKLIGRNTILKLNRWRS